MNLKLKKILLNQEVSNRIACARFCLCEGNEIILNLYIYVTLNTSKYSRDDVIGVSIKGPQVKLISKELEDSIYDATYVALNSGTISESKDNDFVKLCELYKVLFVSCFEKGRFDSINMESLSNVEVGFELIDHKNKKDDARSYLQAVVNRALSENIISADLREIAFSINS